MQGYGSYKLSFVSNVQATAAQLMFFLNGAEAAADPFADLFDGDNYG